MSTSAPSYLSGKRQAASGLLVFCFLVGLGLVPFSSSAEELQRRPYHHAQIYFPTLPNSSSSQSQTITIRVWVDGVEDLIITPTQLQWDHVIQAVFPGLTAGLSSVGWTTVPWDPITPQNKRFQYTEINGEKWVTDWKTKANYSAQDLLDAKPTQSEPFPTTKYANLLTSGKTFTILNATSTEGAGGANTPPTIKQQPDAANGYSLILHFDDRDGVLLANPVDGLSLLEITVGTGKTSSKQPPRNGLMRVNLRDPSTWVQIPGISQAPDRATLRVPTTR